jgi:hypothetical protein
MFGMIGLTPDWDALIDEEKENDSFIQTIEQDDLVEIAVWERKPVLITSTVYEELVHLRVLGKITVNPIENTNSASYIKFLMLVTDADDKKISADLIVRNKQKNEYNVENRFLGDNAIEISEFYIRRLVTKQDGRFCERCKEYSRETKIPKSIIYTCKSCILNPYR